MIHIKKWHFYTNTILVFLYEEFEYIIDNIRIQASRFQIGSLNSVRGSNIKYLPYVYTEQGVAMLTSSLHTDRAIEASIQIVEAFC